MRGEHFGCVVSDAKNEEPEVHEDSKDGLAGDLHAAAPPARGTKGARDLAVDLHPMLTHRFVPETLHLPGENSHVGGTSDSKAVAPKHVSSLGLIDTAHSDFGVWN